MARPMNRGRVFEAVTPSDTAGMAKGSADGFYVGAAGALAIVGEDGDVGTFTVDAGTVMPFGGKRINLTGTTATGIVALYGGPMLPEVAGPDFNDDFSEDFET